MKNYILRYGLLAGIVLIVLGLLNWFTIAQWIGYQASEIFGYSSIVLSLMAIPLGIRYFQKKLNGGRVTFLESLKIGLGITLVTSTVMFFYSLVYFSILGDEFMEWYQNSMSVEEWRAIEVQMKGMPAFTRTHGFQSLVMFVTTFMIGVIITLLSAVILPRANQ